MTRRASPRSRRRARSVRNSRHARADDRPCSPPAAWLVASLVAVVLVTSFGFFAIGLIGLLLWFVCVRVELENNAAVSSGWTSALIVHQHRACERMSSIARASACRPAFLTFRFRPRAAGHELGVWTNSSFSPSGSAKNTA